MKTSTKLPWIPDSNTGVMKENKAMGQEIKKNVVPKDVKRILSSHEILEKYNEQNVFYKKAVLKNFAIFTGKHLCWSLVFNESASFQP